MKTELNARMIKVVTTISIAYEEHCIFLVGVGSQPNRNYENNVKWKKQELNSRDFSVCVFVFVFIKHSINPYKVTTYGI